MRKVDRNIFVYGQQLPHGSPVHATRDSPACISLLQLQLAGPVPDPIRVPSRPCDIKSRSWVYTINNPGENEYDSFRPGSFGQHQLEMGDNGVPHLQGVCHFDQPKTLAGVKKIHGRAHWEVMRGSLKQALAYTSKEETRIAPPVTWGDQPNQGKRTDLHDVAVIIASTEGPVSKKMRAAAEANPSAFIRYYRGFEAYANVMEVPHRKSKPVAWHSWQEWVLRFLRQRPNNRTIVWITDKTGGRGKSTLVQYLITNYPEEHCLLSGQVRDMAYAYKSESVVFFDVPRVQLDQMDHLYSFAEQLKNGSVFSTKYESRLKTFKSPHVVFFANAPPATGKWSEDRLLHIDLEVFTPHTIPVPPFVPPVLPVDNDNPPPTGGFLARLEAAAAADDDVEGDIMSQVTEGSDDESVYRPDDFATGG